MFRRLALWGGAIGAVDTALHVLERVGVLPLRSYGLAGQLTAGPIRIAAT